MKFDFYHRCFMEQAIQPDKPALISFGQVTSWFQLEQSVNAICNDLQQYLDQGVLRAGQPVVIYGHKQHSFVMWILACIRMGIPYVPVDTLYPEERLANIQQQLGQGVLVRLASGNVPQRIQAFDFGVCTLTAPSLMYLLFTSGSTGAPKGVQITYGAFLDFWSWVQQDFPMSELSVLLGQSLFSFDVSVLDIAASMGHGGSLILADRSLCADHRRFFEVLQQYGCTDWVSTPSFVPRWLMSKTFNHAQFPTLKQFTFIGEPLPHRIASELNKRFGNGCVYNAYGPTEATVVVTLLQVDQDVLQAYPVQLPIGYAKPSGDVLILDEQDQETCGEGEIVICGENVSVGYLDPHLPANQAFFQYKGMNAYRTGDYGYAKDRLLFCLGRKDDQIKLNGYRIELGEIEAVIEQLSGVEAAAVLGLKPEQKVVRLVAFVFQGVDQRFDEARAESLKNALADVVPSYMVPSEILLACVKKIPFNSSGKIDRKQLLAWYQADDRMLYQPSIHEGDS
jgi:D-alanine--poly(phosphoribitol) ligase subunit 1